MGEEPGFIAVAVKVTELPWQTGLAEAEMDILTESPWVTETFRMPGVRAGMVLMVMREKRSLARVRVVDVRRRVAGAVIEELLPGAPFPESGDRLVVVTDGE